MGHLLTLLSLLLVVLVESFLFAQSNAVDTEARLSISHISNAVDTEARPSISHISNAVDTEARPSISHITVMGMVYCDICSNNTFSTHSYFLPGAEVRIDCKFKAISPKTTEQISFMAKRTTNRYGIYKLDVPAVEGIECARGTEVVSTCEANLIGSPSVSCDVPGYWTTSDKITIKARRANTCFYSLNALNYRPSKTDLNLCGR